MGLVYADIVLRNPGADLCISVRTMVDSGALLLCIPQHVAIQLQLEELQRRAITLADGSRQQVAYVGPVEVRFENRRCFVGALVLGDEVLLGAIPMEDMDVLIDPARQQLVVNPASPNVPMAPVKWAACCLINVGGH